MSAGRADPLAEVVCGPPDFRFGDCAATPAVDGDAAFAVTRLARFGDNTAADACRLLIGHVRLDRDDAEFVTGLLPASVVVRADARAGRLRRLLRLVAEEAAADRSGRELVLVRLVEVVLVEALRGPGDRTAASGTVPRGLVRGLADPVAGPALVALHADVARPWTVGRLAAAVGASRSVLAERFTRTVGTAPMTYLLHWRLALAKRALIRGDGLAEIAHTVGFGSASGLSAAFLRVGGVRPGHYAQQHWMSPDD